MSLGRIEELARAYLDVVARELSSTSSSLASAVSACVYRTQEWERVNADNWRMTSRLIATPAAVMVDHRDHFRSTPEHRELADALRQDPVVSVMVGKHLGPVGFGGGVVESIETVTDRLVDLLIQAIDFDASGSFSIPGDIGANHDELVPGLPTVPDGERDGASGRNPGDLSCVEGGIRLVRTYAWLGPRRSLAGRRRSL